MTSMPAADRSVRPDAAALALLFAISGMVHWARPAVFDPIVPRFLPGKPRFWTLLSGAIELVLGAAVATPRTRTLGGLLAAAFFVAVFPANVRTVRVVRNQGRLARFLAIARLPLQVPLIALGLRVARTDEPPHPMRGLHG